MFDLFNRRRLAARVDELEWQLETERLIRNSFPDWEAKARTNGRQLAETIAQRNALQAKLDKAQVRPRDARGHFVKRANGADLPA